jgi:hypothetical protein
MTLAEFSGAAATKWTLVGGEGLEGLSKCLEALPAEDAAGECEERGVHVGVALVADA